MLKMHCIVFRRNTPFSCRFMNEIFCSRLSLPPLQQKKMKASYLESFDNKKMRQYQAEEAFQVKTKDVAVEADVKKMEDEAREIAEEEVSCCREYG